MTCPVVFHEATPENTYRSGEPTSETLIFCHIRDGRSDGAVLSLAKKVSSIWSACTGASEDEVEVLVALYPARYVVRGGERLPEGPRLLVKLAADKTMIAAAHMPFPGLGRVRKADTGAGYDWVPATFLDLK